MDPTIELKIEKNFKYEINVCIQTPLDARPFHIGSFILNKNIQIGKEFTGSNYKKMSLKENPFIFSNYWAECISNNYAIISFYKESLEDASEINYLLDDPSKLFLF